MDVKDFHLKTKWVWLFLLTVLGGIWAEVFMLCQHSNSDYHKEVLTLQLEISGYSYWPCVISRSCPLCRSRMLNMLWPAGLPPAVLAAPQPSFWGLPSVCVSQPQHWAVDSKSISRSPQGTRCLPSVRSAGPLTSHGPASPHPIWLCGEKGKRKKRGELRQLTVFGFIYYFFKFFIFSSKSANFWN